VTEKKQAKKVHLHKWHLIGAVILLIALVIGIRVFVVRGSIEPKRMATCETKMWRAFAEDDRKEIATQFVFLLKDQYGLSLAESASISAELGKAASQLDSSAGSEARALAALEEAYESISRESGLEFDSKKAARAELDSWTTWAKGDGEEAQANAAKSISEVYATVYGGMRPEFEEAGRLRAEALALRHEGGKDADWIQIESLLKQSYSKVKEGRSAP